MLSPHFSEPLVTEASPRHVRSSVLLSLLAGAGLGLLLSSTPYLRSADGLPGTSLFTQPPRAFRQPAAHALAPLIEKSPARARPMCQPMIRSETEVGSPLLARRSVVKYDTSKTVPAEVTSRALEAAILAPNHFLTEPWRFYALGPETKSKMAGLNEDKRKMVEGVPEMVVVTMSSEHDEGGKLYYEDHAAVACATQNFMLSLAEQGVGSKWMTGALGVPPETVLSAVGAPFGEKLMGVIWYGYPTKALSADAKAPPRKKGLDGVLQHLP